MSFPRHLAGRLILFFLLGWLASEKSLAGGNVHITYHWHLHQPIYWPEKHPNLNRYQFGAESVDLKNSPSGQFYPGDSFNHPRNSLAGEPGEFDQVFSKDDRKIAYQYGGKDSIATLSNHPNAGASVSYSGALMENIWSFGKDNRLGYTPGWNSGYSTARQWLTSGGKPKADMLGMTFHHAFSPLLPKSVLRKEIQIFKELWWKTWEGNPDKSDHSRGFWPVEAAFSETMIPILVSEGYQWAIIANSHLARTCANYMDVAQRGNSGWNIDPPNRADQLGPSVPANQWWSGTQDGRGGAFPAPFAYQAHRAKYVDPNTGAESRITVVPMCDLLSYQNGYGTMGTGDIDTRIAPFNNPAQPSIVLMAHDGDNAWGGGHSYYQESVPNLMNAAASHGYHPTTIQHFLQDHPPPENDVVHVEDGAWVNAANDWGHPQFINWLWPPTRLPGDPARQANDPRTWYDLETPGWTEDWRNWAVIVAATNFCETAEQITITNGGSVAAWKIQEPTQQNGTNNNPNNAEQAWHYLLGGLDSGFMYYGTSLDDEAKQTLAANRAINHASAVVGNAAQDQTPPTIFKPQRFPWNPGGMGWGPLTGYKEVGFNGQPSWPSDFHVWTHVFDVSGTTNVTLFVRASTTGTNPLSNNENETYAGGASVGPWQALPMTRRAVPTGNITNNPEINFFQTPSHLADYFWAKVAGYRSKLLDYYVEAVDGKGHVAKSDIQHVWVGDDGTSLNPQGIPQNLIATAVNSGRVDLTWDPADLAASYNILRDGALLANSSANSYSDTTVAPATTYSYQVVAVNSAGSSGPSNTATATTPWAPLPFVLDGTADAGGYLHVNPGMTLYAAVRGTQLYVATWSPGNSGGANDHFILVSDSLEAQASIAAPWAKAGLTARNAAKPFLAAESSNSYAGWFHAPANSALFKAATNAGQLEGVIDLVETFGALPSTVFLAASAYATPDGGGLAAQAPSGNGNDNLDPPEFTAFPLHVLIDEDANGVLDHLEPDKAFKVEIKVAIHPATGFVVEWPVVPGRTYQVQYRETLSGQWLDITNARFTAASGQSEMSYTDAAAAGLGQRFYRVVLINPQL